MNQDRDGAPTGVPAHGPITLDTSHGGPPYEPIRTQIAAQVASGELSPGTKLPTVRALAETLGIAPNTVGRACHERGPAGGAPPRGRNGTVVNGDGSDRAAKEAAAGYADVMR